MFTQPGKKRQQCQNDNNKQLCCFIVARMIDSASSHHHITTLAHTPPEYNATKVEGKSEGRTLPLLMTFSISISTESIFAPNLVIHPYFSFVTDLFVKTPIFTRAHR